MNCWYLNGRKHGRVLYRTWLQLRTRYWSAHIVYSSTRSEGANRVRAFTASLVQLFFNSIVKVTLTFLDDNK